MSIPIIHCQWEDETVRERTGRSPSYAGAKKIKPLIVHIQGWLNGCLFFSHKVVVLTETEPLKTLFMLHYVTPASSCLLHLFHNNMKVLICF